MNLTQQATDYLANNAQAREILRNLDVRGNKVLGHWYVGGTAEKDFKDIQPRFGTLSATSDSGQYRNALYEGRKASQADKVARELCELAILELNSCGWCSSPIRYALKGEWNFKHKDGMVSFRFTPHVEDRKQLAELVSE